MYQARLYGIHLFCERIPLVLVVTDLEMLSDADVSCCLNRSAAGEWRACDCQCIRLELNRRNGSVAGVS